MNGELGEIIERINVLLANLESPEEQQHALGAILATIERHRPKTEGLNNGEAAESATLTDSERRLICLTVAGMANKMIARELDISIRTVHLRRTALMKKLGASNRAELVRMAVQGGFCDEH